jgi:hypothetical protein
MWWCALFHELLLELPYCQKYRQIRAFLKFANLAILRRQAREWGGQQVHFHTKFEHYVLKFACFPKTSQKQLLEALGED